MSDHRKNELSDTEIEAKIAERATRARRDSITTIGGIVGGVSGIAFAFVALIKFESVMLSSLGFVMMCVGFGLAIPAEIARLLTFRK